MNNKKIKACDFDMKSAIFDLDGTLLDSMWVWDQVDLDFLGKRGFDVPDDYTKAIAHMDAHSTARYTIERFGLNETIDNIVDEWFEMAKDKYSNEVICKPGAYEYVEKLHNRGVKIAIATSSDKVLFEKTLERTGLSKYIDAIVMVKEVGKGKSHPDVYLEAARRLGVNPCETVVYEDILAGILGAKKGGFRTAAVYEQRSNEDEKEILRECDYYIDNFTELV